MQFKPGPVCRARGSGPEQADAEQRLWHSLRARQLGGLRFLRWRPVYGYILDLYCPELRLAVEVIDRCKFEDPDLDRERIRRLATAGIRVIRFDHRQVVLHTVDVLEQILWVAESLKGR